MSTIAVLLALALAAAAPPNPSATFAGRLVIAEPERHRVELVSPDGAHRTSAPTGLGPRGLALHAGRILVADAGTERAPGSTLTAIDAASGIALETLQACDACAPRAIGIGERGTVWITAASPPSIVELAGGSRRPIALEGGVVPGRVAMVGTRWLVAGSRGGSLVVVDRVARRASTLDIGPSPELIAARPGTSEVWAALNPEGRLVAVGFGGDAPEIVRRASAPAFPQGLAFAPDGATLLVTGGRERVLALIDATTGKESGRLKFESAPRDVTVSPDGRAAAVFLPEEGRVAIVDLAAKNAPEAAGTFPLDVGVLEWEWIP